MKKLLILLVVVLGITSCSPRFFVRTESELKQMDLALEVRNYIPIADSLLLSSEILNKTYSMLQKEKFWSLNKYLSSKTTDNQDYYLARTMALLSEGGIYAYEALEYWKKLDGEQYPVLKDLMLIDISTEIAQKQEIKNKDKFLSDYQALINKYPNNELLKQLVVIRMRYIKNINE